MNRHAFPHIRTIHPERQFMLSVVEGHQCSVRTTFKHKERTADPIALHLSADAGGE